MMRVRRLDGVELYRASSFSDVIAILALFGRGW
jgi:hypothetical protein